MGWTKKSKIASNYQNKAKIPTRFERTRILTVDNNQILAGSNEDLILIAQEEGTMWNFKTKTT